MMMMFSYRMYHRQALSHQYRLIHGGRASFMCRMLESNAMSNHEQEGTSYPSSWHPEMRIVVAADQYHTLACIRQVDDSLATMWRILGGWFAYAPYIGSSVFG